MTGNRRQARGAAVGPRDVLGVPVLPPAAATRATQRLRDGLTRLQRAPAPPPVRILEGLLGVLDVGALHALCRIDVPDRLTAAVDLDTLAADLGVDLRRLQRLLDYATARGWVRRDRRHRYRPTPVLRFLRTDHPGGWRAWVEFMGSEEILASVAHLDAGLHADGDPFAVATGSAFFDFLAAHPARHATFDAAMAAGGRMHGLVLAQRLDWGATTRVCDIGGGTGTLLTTLVDAHPHLDGVLLELPEVAARAERHPRLTAVAGDAFQTVPDDADTYLLVNVLHDWGDDDARTLLRSVAAALESPSDGAARRLIVVESRTSRHPRPDLSHLTDLLMFALTAGGRERTPAELAELAASAGLELRRTIGLPTSSDAHVLTLESSS